MIGYFQKDRSNKRIGDVLLVPFNFVIYGKEGGRTKIIYDVDMLEDLTLNLIDDRESIREDIEDGLTEIVNVNDDFLRDFRELVVKRQDEKACYKLVGLFEFIKVIKSDEGYEGFGDCNINNYNPLLDKDGYDYPEFFEE